jgi:SAM-dependent methyltransferase
MEHSIYEFPDIFRRVHMEEPSDIGREVRFMRRLWRKHAPKPVGKVLDIACGNSPHGQLLARDGIEVVGIDRSQTMIAAGRKESRGIDGIRFYRRPIEKFSIPEHSFDAAFFMSETFPVITDNDDILSHLQSVGRLLKHGALYCVDVDRHDGVRMVQDVRLWKRKVRVGAATVRVRGVHRPAPWHSGIYSNFEITCSLRFPDRVVNTRDVVPIRYTLPCTMDLLARASGMFEMIAVYTDLSLTKPIDKCYGRWWAVLRRR